MLLDQLSTISWVTNNGIKTEAGEPIDFSKYRFMYDVYADRSRLICAKKCLDPKTKILTADLKWKQLGDISVGDKLFSVDEIGTKKGRRFRTATVEDKWESKQDSYRILFEDGREIIASGSHKFLTKKYSYNTDTAWKELSQMKVGDVVRHIVKPWGDSNIDDGWFGGIIDGEGHIRTQSGVQIDIVQNPGEISDKIEKYLVDNKIKFRKDFRNKKELGNKHINCFEVSSTEDSIALFGKCQPVKFLRKQSIFENKKVGGTGKSWAKIVSIELAGKRTLIDIQTSTRTFIAEGLVTHNCAQIGFTTYEILKTAHECNYDKIDILYVLPTADDVKRFSGGKTNKIIAHNPSLQAWTKDKDSIEQKQFGQNTVYYQGSWTERAALMITAKKLVVDEYDRCKQDIVEQYDSRLQSIAEPRKAFFSNPSMPDFGIDKWYKKSDQKKWHIHHSCGETYPMTEDCVDYNAEIYRCPKCKQEITDEERRMGDWIATAEGEWSGYWIPLWIAPWISAKYIAKEKREKTEEYFANFVAGEPYYGLGNKVLPDTVFRNLTRKINDQSGRIIIGSDTGIPNYYVIGNKDGLFYYGSTKDFNTYREYLKRWPTSVAVFDGQGELYEQRKLQEEFPGRVFLCFYRKDRKGQEIIKWGEGKEYGSVAVDRNRAIQLVIDELNQKLIPLQGTESEWNEYASHWFNIYRTKEEDALGKPVYTWERMGADHLVHATVLWRVGMSKFAQGKGEFLTDKPQFGETSAFNNVFNAEFL